MRRGEGALCRARSGGQQLQHLDELVVRVRDRWVAFVTPVGVGDPHLVVTVDLDVLHRGVVDQRLQPAETEERGHYGPPGGQLDVHRPRLLTAADPLPAPCRQLRGHQRTGQLTTSLRRLDGQGLQAPGEPLSDHRPDLAYQRGVRGSQDRLVRTRGGDARWRPPLRGSGRAKSLVQASHAVTAGSGTSVAICAANDRAARISGDRSSRSPPRAPSARVRAAQSSRGMVRVAEAPVAAVISAVE